MSSYTSIPSCDDGVLAFDALTARASTSSIEDGSRRRLRPMLAFTFAAAAVVGVVAAGQPPFRRTSATVAFDELDPMHVGKHNNDSVDTYTEREAYEILRTHNGTMTCDEVTYAYCGSATCRLTGDGLTANCGCQKIENTSGTFHFQSGNSYLATSHIFRNVLYKWMEGDTKRAQAMLCGSLREGTFWRSMGYEGYYGSFSYGNGGATDMWKYNKDINCDVDKYYNFAYAMGAPCSWDTPYNDRYPVTCAVPYTIANGKDLIAKFPQMLNITAVGCGEILAEKKACGIQKTFTEGHTMTNYSEMRKYNTALHAATYSAYGGDDCPTV